MQNVPDSCGLLRATVSVCCGYFVNFMFFVNGLSIKVTNTHYVIKIYVLFDQSS